MVYVKLPVHGAVHDIKMYSMAGIIKRNNKWVAVFRTLDGKEIRKTTRVDVVPKVIPPGVNKRALLSQNEARARLIAEELETDIRRAS